MMIKLLLKRLLGRSALEGAQFAVMEVYVLFMFRSATKLGNSLG